MLSGALTYLRGTRKKRVPFFQVTSLSALASFAAQIENDTHAQVIRVVVSEVQDIKTGTQSAPEQEYDGYYAVFRFKNPSPEDGENPRREFHLADPLESMFEVDDNGKLIVRQSEGEKYAGWYSALTGKTYEFVKGWLWQS